MTAREAVEALRSRFAEAVSQPSEFRGELTVRVERASWELVARFLREHLGFDYLVDISSVDHLDADPRFEVIYELARLDTWTHLRLKVAAPEDAPEVPSVVPIWPTANWHEREVYDMMGIRFPGHPDLRRILMWEGYPYFPLRKDFPLEGLPTEVPEVAFTEPAPLAGGPFVSVATTADTRLREPRARRPGDTVEESAR